MLSFGDDVNDNFFFLAVSEVIGSLLSVSVKMKFNRIPSLAVFGLISSSASIAIFFPTIPIGCFHLMETCYQKGLLVLLAMVIIFNIYIRWLNLASQYLVIY